MKRRILFVDDESNILQGLRRTFRRMRSEWDMVFATSGEDALAAIDEAPFDVVVSDMRMPVMDGAAVLEESWRRMPGAIRFVLSGQADRETTYRAVGNSHQFLAKPCDPDYLIGMLSRCFDFHEKISDPVAISVANSLRSLPTPARQRNPLSAALMNESVPVSLAGDLISRDPGLSTRVLQLVNSSYFDIGTTIECPAKAVKALEIESLRILSEMDRFSVALADNIDAPAYERVVDESYLLALIAKRIAAHEELDPRVRETVYTAGLLRGIGKLLSLLFAGLSIDDAHATILSAYFAHLWAAPAAVVDLIELSASPADLAEQENPAAQCLGGALAICELADLPSTFAIKVGPDRYAEWQSLCDPLLQTSRVA